MVVCGLNVVSIGVQPNSPKPKRQTLSFNLVNGNFSVNIGQFTSYQALDWLHKANSTVRACHCLRRLACQLFATDCCHRSEQHCIKSCRFRTRCAHSDYCKFANGTVGVCTALRIRTCSNLFSQFAASNFSTPSTRNPSLSPNRNVLRLAQPATIERWLVTSMQSTCAMIFCSPPFQGRIMTRCDWIRYPSLRTTLLCIMVLSFSPRTLISCLCSRPA